MAAAKKIQLPAIAPGKDHNPANLMKANKRMSQIIEKHKVFDEPQRLQEQFKELHVYTYASPMQRPCKGRHCLTCALCVLALVRVYV